MCSFISKHFHNSFRKKSQCFSWCRFWIKQWSSLVNRQLRQNYNLQFMLIITELVYISRRRTTSFNENDTRVIKYWKYNALTNEETQIQQWCHFRPTMYNYYSVRLGLYSVDELSYCLHQTPDPLSTLSSVSECPSAPAAVASSPGSVDWTTLISSSICSSVVRRSSISSTRRLSVTADVGRWFSSWRRSAFVSENGATALANDASDSGVCFRHGVRSR